MNSAERLILSLFPHQPTQGQMEACHNIVEFLFDHDPHSTFLLHGYAGTGKTSLVAALIKAAPMLKIKTVLMAPTGRAAKVLSSYSQRKAYTIHKKIYTTVEDGSGMVRCIRARNKNAYTLFIVDEASMIGNTSLDEDFASRRSLLEDLLDYVADGSHCRLMLIGDTAQLPPVGCADSPALSENHLLSLADLKIYTSSLTEVVRQQSLSGILATATSLRNSISHIGNYDMLPMPLFNIEGLDDVVRIHGSELVDTLNGEYGSFGPEGVVFVCRSNKRANMYNQAIRNRILFREDEINTGDYLMVVKNNYYWLEEDSDMGFIANGDIVEVLGARHFQELYGFHFVDVTLRFTDYPDAPTLDCKIMLETLHSESPSLTRDESQHLFSAVMEDYVDLPTKAERLNALRANPYYNALQVKFAYALTCHKTQGGQWPTVFVDQGYITDDMLDKEYLRWLYTAVTRATGKVYLLNFEDRFFNA